jgi:prepilin peptidase CpaA
MDTLSLILLAALPLLVIVAALTDLTSMRIPNWISLALLATFFPTAFAVALSPLAIALHIGAGVVALLIGMGLNFFRLLGGGDVKLMAACAVWMGLQGAGMFVLWTGVMGGVFCLFLLIGRARFQPWAANGPAWFAELLRPKAKIPYGLAICAGALMAYPASPLVSAFIAG